MLILLIILAILVLLALLYVAAICPVSTKRDFSALDGYYYAHRGLHGFTGCPENSLSAFREAAARGFGAELDIHLTKDGRLAVMHDESLARTAGADVNIGSLTAEQLSRYNLSGGEPIPFLEEVLPIFDGVAPLIIELKTVGPNAAALCRTLMDTMEGYSGVWCMESFDPRAVRWMHTNRPEIIRGQLSMRFRDGSTLSRLTAFALTNLLTNFLTRPDFVAYQFEDRRQLAFRLATGRLGARRVYWTLRSRRDFNEALSQNALPIFEGFDPAAE